MKMSEEKLYAVKNDKGQYWEFKDLCGIDLGGFWELLDVSVPFTASEDDAKNTAKDHGGNVVTLIEEPKKVVLTKEQAEIVEDARNFDEDPAGYISDNTNLAASGEEELLMRAYVNGYTVEKEKKYNVKVPHTKDVWYYKTSEAYLQTICPADDKKLRGKFTITDIEHYGLQDCERVEINTEDSDDK